MQYTDTQIEAFRKEFPSTYPYVMTADMLLIQHVDFSSLRHRHLVCSNHPWTRYATKNPFERSIFFLQGVNGLTAMLDEECDCPFTDLRVVIEKETED